MPEEKWVKVNVQNQSIPSRHRKLRKIRPGVHYFTETPELVVVTPQIRRWLANGSLIAVDPPPADAVLAEDE